MARKKLNVSLRSYEDIFSTEESRQNEKLEHVQMIHLDELHPFKNHPFKVIDDESMEKTVESIRQLGVLSPAIARPRPEGGYELVSGHRRHHASGKAGLETMPVIVRDLDDDEATILLVDANLQREYILPSERAKAYKMKMEAMKHQGERKDLQGEVTSRQVDDKLKGKIKTADIIGMDTGESGRQVQRYIRLNKLIPELLDMVDNKQIAFNPAVELSYLSEDQQKNFIEAMDYAQAPPTLSQAQRIKKLSQDTSADDDPSKPDGACSMDAMLDILMEQKKADLSHVTLKTEQIKQYFPKSYTPKQMEETIIKLLAQWQRKKKREQCL